MNKTKVVAIRLTSDEHESLTYLAKRTHKTLAVVLREILEKGFPVDTSGNLFVRGNVYKARCRHCRKGIALQAGVITAKGDSWAHKECEAAHGLQS
jgi:hypothetical protein